MTDKKYDIEKGIKNVITALSEGLKSDLDEKNQDLIQSIKNILENSRDPIFDLNYSISQYTQAIETAITDKFGSNSAKAAYVMAKFDWLSHCCEFFIKKTEGMSCCVDKSHHIVGRYLNSLKPGNTFKLDSQKEYWTPKVIPEEIWYEYLESLFALMFGKQDDYMKSLVKISAFLTK